MSKEIQNLNPLQGEISFTDLAPIKRPGDVEPYKATIAQLLDFIADNIDLSNIIPKGSFRGLVQSLDFKPSNPVNGDTWLAVLPGVYTKFSGQSLTKSIGVFLYNGNSWILSQQDIIGVNTGGGTINVSSLNIERIPLPNVGDWIYTVNTSIFGNVDAETLDYKVISNGKELNPDKNYSGNTVYLAFGVPDPDNNNQIEPITGTLYITGPGSGAGNTGGGNVETKTITRVASDILGTDPDYYLDLSNTDITNYAIMPTAYVNYSGSNNDVDYEPVATRFYPGSKQLHGFFNKTDYPNAKIIISYI